jgi:hypothetical protein
MFFTSRSDGELVVPDFYLIFNPLRVTMSRKSSLPQGTKSVSLALTPNTRTSTWLTCAPSIVGPDI